MVCYSLFFVSGFTEGWDTILQFIALFPCVVSWVEMCDTSAGGGSMVLRYISHQGFFWRGNSLSFACTCSSLCDLIYYSSKWVKVAPASGAIQLLPSGQFSETHFPRGTLTPLSYVNGASLFVRVGSKRWWKEALEGSALLFCRSSLCMSQPLFNKNIK